MPFPGFEPYTAAEFWDRSASVDFDTRVTVVLIFITSMAPSMNRGTPEFTPYRLLWAAGATIKDWGGRGTFGWRSVRNSRPLSHSFCLNTKIDGRQPSRRIEKGGRRPDFPNRNQEKTGVTLNKRRQPSMLSGDVYARSWSQHVGRPKCGTEGKAD